METSICIILSSNPRSFCLSVFWEEIPYACIRKKWMLLKKENVVEDAGYTSED